MNEVNAFVGHSFTTDDSEVVSAFLKYFGQIKMLHPTFSWENAEAAEPRELAEKVLSLIAGKNVFIGICTKKERVINPRSLLSMFFQPLYRKAKESDFEWKTSDWIIQEIGLARGRGLDLVLLIEEGLRLPGSLQGNVEYISFDRAAPEKSFGKIVEMIHALSPKAPATAAASADSPVASAVDSESLPPSDSDWMTPTPEWNRDNYRRAMFHMIVGDDVAGANRIHDAYLATVDALEGDSAAEWEATGEYMRILFGKGGSLDRLKQLADDHPKNGEILSDLAIAYSVYEDHAKAARTFEGAAKLTDDILEAQRLMGRAAIQDAKSGNLSSAKAIIEQLKTTAATDLTAERQLLGFVRDLANISKDDNAALTAMERIVEIAPDDLDIRFALAFKHSELGNEDLALCHYLRIPISERNQLTWNNLGVSFGSFSMPGKSVRAYRKAEEMGETLAMSNLGYNFMNAGFLKEAQEEFDKALATRDFHKNIGHGLATLKDVPDEEDKKEREVLENARPKSEFYKLLGRAISQPDPSALPARWHGPNCELDVTLSGSKFRAIGNYERDAGRGLFGALGPGPKLVTRYRLEYEGNVIGRQIEGTVQRIHQGDASAASTLLGLSDVKTKVLIVISDDGKELRVMENPHGKNPSFHSLHAI